VRAFVSVFIFCACRDQKVASVDASAGIDIGFLHDFSPAPSTDEAGPPVFDAGFPDLESAPKSGKSVGHTSVVFRIKLENGPEISFKPESKRGKKRYRGEIAAYRLASALGLRNVIPAMPRDFDAAQLRAALEPKARTLFDDEAIVRDGKVRGAAIPWLAKLELIALEAPAWRARWPGWIGSGDVSEDQRALAGQISTMIIFDLLTGNWDRWSGANIAIDHATNTLLFIDNDGAFFDPPPPQPLAQQTALMKKTERFSRAFIASLRALTTISLGDDDGPIVSEAVISGILSRRKLVLDQVDALVSARGEASVLAFP